MTLKKLIQRSIDELKKSGSLTPEIDVSTLIKSILTKDDVYLVTHDMELLTNAQYQKFRRLIRRRKKGEPVAYLTGHKEFYGLDFIVNKNVLIPRPETEVLVESALSFIKQSSIGTLRQGSIIDVGTGSGCIIISLVKNLLAPRNMVDTKFYATDISAKALKLAKQNAKKHEVYDDVQFYLSDLFSNPRLPKKFDLIIANLPYLEQDKPNIMYREPHNIGLNFEPETALFAAKGGFSLIENLVNVLPSKLTSSGAALIEINASQAQRLNALCSKKNLRIHPIHNQSKYPGFYRISLN